MTTIAAQKVLKMLEREKMIDIDRTKFRLNVSFSEILASNLNRYTAAYALILSVRAYAPEASNLEIALLAGGLYEVLRMSECRASRMIKRELDYLVPGARMPTVADIEIMMQQYDKEKSMK